MQVSIEFNIDTIKCPISHQIFLEPVLGDDGFTYESDEILNWMKTKQVSPITDKSLTKVIPNLFAKMVVDEFLHAHPEYRIDQYVPNRQHKDYIAEVAKIMKDKQYLKLLDYNSFQLDELYKVSSDSHVEFFKSAPRRVLRHVIDNAVDLEAKSPRGSRLVHLVCAYSTRSMQRLVIKKGVNLETENNCATRPIQIACRGNSLKTVKDLIAKGVNLLPVDGKKWSALHFAARYAEKDLIEYLATIVSKEEYEKGTDADFTPASLVTYNDKLTKKEKLEILSILL